MAEVGEGADHAHRLVAAQALEQRLEFAVGTLVVVVPKCHRQLSDLLDQIKRRRTILLADHIAQDATEQPDVVDQRLVFVGRFGVAERGLGTAVGGGFHGGDC